MEKTENHFTAPRDAVIFSGGSIDGATAEAVLARHEGAFLCAADRGVEFMESAGIVPDLIIGDFDSASRAAFDLAQKISNERGVPLIRLVPEKDDTDTEAALKQVFERVPGGGDVIILGGTGSRLDHVLGNLSILGMGRAAGKRVLLVDRTNRARLLTPGEYAFSRADQYGKYVSFFPIGGPVQGLTLTGFKYPLSDADLSGETSLAVSNEIISAEGNVFFAKGKLLMIEAAD